MNSLLFSSNSINTTTLRTEASQMIVESVYNFLQNHSAYIALCVGISYSLFYRFYIKGMVQLLYHPTELNKHLIKNMPTLFVDYNPPFWLFSSHLQGVLALLLRTKHPIPYRSEEIKALDGGILHLNWAEAPDAPEDAPILLVVPGVTGGRDKPYVSQMVHEAYNRKWRALVLVFPGCLIEGNTRNRCKSGRFFSPADVSDIEIVVSHIHNKYPQAPIFGVGHSMGASMLVKYLERAGENTPLTSVLSVSNPWCFCSVHNNLEQGIINRHVYNTHFYSYWLESYLADHHAFMSHKSIIKDQVTKVKSLREFEDLVSRRVYGYQSTDSYFKDISCVQSVEKVKKPLLVVHAMDDPIVPPSALPLQQLQNNPNCLCVLTQRGGHSGWLQGIFPSGLCYADQVCLEFIEAFTKHKKT